MSETLVFELGLLKSISSLLRFVSEENKVTARLAGPRAQIQTHSKSPGMPRIICH